MLMDAPFELTTKLFSENEWLATSLGYALVSLLAYFVFLRPRLARWRSRFLQGKSWDIATDCLALLICAMAFRATLAAISYWK
jgi:small neutral amino acid transporter SnatA (MarC family)